MREKTPNKFRKDKTPSKSYYSVQVSSRDPAASETNESKTKEFIKKAKTSIEFLSNEVHKYRKQCVEQESILELEKKHNEGLNQKATQLRQQLEKIWQQNAKLKAAKNELVSEVEQCIAEKGRTRKEKSEAREQQKTAIQRLIDREARRDKKFRKASSELEQKRIKQIEVHGELEEEVARTRGELAELRQKRNQVNRENENLSKEFGQEVDILSHIITIS